MSGNVGSSDSKSRIAAGIILVAFAMISGNIIGWLGIILIITGIIGYCPLYTVLKMDTCGCRSGEEHH